MNDQYAIHTQLEADRFAGQANQRLGEIVSDLVRLGPEGVSTYGTQAMADLIGATARSAGMLAQQELEAAMRARGMRSFAAGDLETELAEFYSTYLPQLVGDWSARERRLLMDRLARGERERVPQGTTAAEIAAEFGVSYGRGNTIVRTESTRAASLTRRFVALRALGLGKGPDFFVYKSLLDDRVTQTCKRKHNVYWSVGEDRLEWWPPSHFNCRAGVVFAWEGDPALGSYAHMTPMLSETVRQIQKAEFPSWENNRITGPVFRVGNTPRRGMPEITEGALERLDTMRGRLAPPAGGQTALERAQEAERRRQREALQLAQRQLTMNRIKFKLRR